MRNRVFFPLLCGVLWAGAAQGEGRVPKPLTEVLSGDAKAAYETGKLLFTDGDFAGASLKFRQALELGHDARLLWNIAASEKNLRHYARASAFTRRYLSEASALMTGEHRAAAQQALAAMAAFLGEVVVLPEPSEAVVFLDGERQGQRGGNQKFMVDQGRRVVRVEHDGYDPFEKTVEVLGGHSVSLPAVLERLSMMGKLAVIATEGASIDVDGAVVGQSRWGGELLPGPHTLRVTLVGKKAHQASVDISARSLRTVDVTLEDEVSGLLSVAPESRSNAIWWWLGGVAATGAAVGVTYMLLAPGPASPGSTPGTLGSVKLPLMTWGSP